MEKTSIENNKGMEGKALLKEERDTLIPQTLRILNESVERLKNINTKLRHVNGEVFNNNSPDKDSEDAPDATCRSDEIKLARMALMEEIDRTSNELDKFLNSLL